MSLRLLQKSLSGHAGAGASGAGATEGQGRGGGRRSCKTMSLREFQSSSGGSSGRCNPPRSSVWGNAGGGACGGKGGASGGKGATAGPRPGEHWDKEPARTQSCKNAWDRGPPGGAVGSVWGDAPRCTSETVGGVVGSWEEISVDEETVPNDWGAASNASCKSDGGDWNAPVATTPPRDRTAVVAKSVSSSGLSVASSHASAAAAVAFAPTLTEAAATVSNDGTSHREEDGLIADVTAWLIELNLSCARDAVLAWCDEMGAARLEEVAESAEDLAEALSLKPLQAKRLRVRGQEALEAVRNGGKVDSRTDSQLTDGRGSSSSAAAFAVAAQAPVEELCATLLPVPAAAVGASGGVFFNKAQPQSFYAASSGGGFPGAGSAGQSPDASPTDSAAASVEDRSVKQRPTERATWTPTVKVGQGARRKQQREAIEEVALRELSEARAAIVLAISAAEADYDADGDDEALSPKAALAALRAAVAHAETAGVLPADEMEAAREALRRSVARWEERCRLAAETLRVVLGMPRDAAFGERARAALAGAEDALETDDGDGAVEDCEAWLRTALREWELAEQRREEANMALHFAMRRGDVKALEVALDEARAAGLSDDEELFVQAADALRDAIEREAANAAATERLRVATETRDLAALERAVEECLARQLQVKDAVTLMETLRVEATARAEATAELQAAVEGHSTAALKAALARARQSDLEASLVERAEARIIEIEVMAKRRHNASVELHLACSCSETSRLETALAEGRRWGVAKETLDAAEESLAEARDAERRRSESRLNLADAMRRREVVSLRIAIEAAEALLTRNSQDGIEIDSARRTLRELEQEAQRAREARVREEAETALDRAVKAGDWDGIQDGRARLIALGSSEESEALRLAEVALDGLREAREIEEAKREVEAAEALLRDLAKQESALVGPAHKKERAALGKRVMELKADFNYLSAIRFLRNPKDERIRREERRLEIERRRVQASEELGVAIAARDEVVVRQLLAEGALGPADAESGRTFQAEQESRREAAARDATLLEFSFVGLDRRSFFQASVAMNELFTERYSMQEGHDFKLKVVKASNSVLVAFRSCEFAEIVRTTAVSFASKLNAGHRGAVVASAEIKSPLDFSYEAQECLPALRQDAENLRSRPARSESERAVREASSLSSVRNDHRSSDGIQVSSGRNDGLRSAMSLPADAATSSVGRRTMTHADAFEAVETTATTTSAAPAVQCISRTATTTTTAPSGDCSARSEDTQSAWPALPQAKQKPIGAQSLWRGQSEMASTSFDTKFGTGASRGGGGGGWSAYPAFDCKSKGAWDQGGGGDGHVSGGNVSVGSGAGGEDVIKLQPHAAASLQSDKAKATSLHSDLRRFAGKFRVAAELRGLDSVVVRPMGNVHKEALRRARAELDGLLDFYFPQLPQGAAEANGHGEGQQLRRRVRLRVDADSGAGIELTVTALGYGVDHVEDFPGQDFAAGEVIVQIGDRELAGLSEDAMEDAFAEGFAHGAELMLIQGGCAVSGGDAGT
eukprot:TRINITY_DN24749_c0_g1_i1.p1 TRINITY_DN24749_c0_g1~~TRINITY_DN24749_c0_g1_i1.p1  ORF type:complete len:1523 (-),score=345.44 TRINITY_DN24749_c0_g1_i1:21-4589(-)